MVLNILIFILLIFRVKYFSGTITKDEIKAVLRKCGEDIDEAEIDEMLKLVDADGDGNISIDGMSDTVVVTC